MDVKMNLENKDKDKDKDKRRSKDKSQHESKSTDVNTEMNTNTNIENDENQIKFLDYKTVEGYNLDIKQIKSIEDNSRNVLVIAGAGTGKTTTIIGKIKYILRKVPPQVPKILVISFTHASKEELKQRITREILKNNFVFSIFKTSTFAVETFHSLSLKIVKTKQPQIRLSEIDFKSFLKEQEYFTNETSIEVKEEILSFLEQLYGVMRNYRLDFPELENRNRQRYRHLFTREIFDQNEKMIRLLKNTASAYQEYCKNMNFIDFPGLIEEAIKELLESHFEYDYVIIDEYQDISPLEYQLIKSLRELYDFQLFCVGDDWQTIYQFAGSEIKLITEFAKYWGETKIHKIENTYRFSNLLADVSGKFIMKNPAQLVKNIHGYIEDDLEQIIEINGPSERTDLDSLYFFFLDLPKKSSIFFIGRYNFDIQKILHCRFLEIQEEKILFSERTDLRITFLTAHRSKGLQADYVFIINCCDGVLGFPSQLISSTLIDLVIENKVSRRRKSQLFAEERRLFYVAMTRAKKKLFLLTTRDHESYFIEELREMEKLVTYKLD